MTTNYFARYIGLPRGENLYQIKRGNNGISRKIANMITAAFPSISMMWLLIGEGDMFSTPELSTASTPLYDIDINESIRNIASLEPKSYMVLPPEVDCDLGVVYRGRAMSSITPTNSVILLKKIIPSEIISGDECVIVTKKFVLLRIVKICRVSPSEFDYILVTSNPEKYGDIAVEAHEIESVYRVKGKILIN